MAHSKQSNVWESPPDVTVKDLSYSFPQTSHCAMMESFLNDSPAEFGPVEFRGVGSVTIQM
jgi:hypothetical protein